MAEDGRGRDSLWRAVEQIPGNKREDGGGRAIVYLGSLRSRAAEFNSNKLRPRILFGSKILFRPAFIGAFAKPLGPDHSPAPPYAPLRPPFI